MKKKQFAIVEKLAKGLPQQERLKLFTVLANLPDSGIKYMPPMESAPPPTEEERNALQQITYQYSVKIEEGYLIYLIEGREVFRAKFNPENYADVFYDKLKTDQVFLRLSDEQREKVKAALRQVVGEEKMEMSERKWKSLETRCLKEMGQRILKDSMVHSAEQVASQLPQAVALVFERINHASFFVGANQLRDVLNLPQQKLSAEKIREALYGREWGHLKQMFGITQGGARNIKHRWTDKQRQCLAQNYERLKPIWLEAKRIARDAQGAKESNRRLRWAEAASATYPELDADLIARLAPDSSDARPADIALTHATRICIPGKTFSTRKLREEIRKVKT